MHWLPSTGSWHVLWTALVLLWTSSFCTSWQLLCFRLSVSVHTHTHACMHSHTCTHTLTHAYMDAHTHSHTNTPHNMLATHHQQHLCAYAIYVARLYGAIFRCIDTPASYVHTKWMGFTNLIHFTGFYLYGAGNNIVSDHCNSYWFIYQLSLCTSFRLSASVYVCICI